VKKDENAEGVTEAAWAEEDADEVAAEDVEAVEERRKRTVRVLGSP